MRGVRMLGGGMAAMLASVVLLAVMLTAIMGGGAATASNGGTATAGSGACVIDVSAESFDGNQDAADAAAMLMGRGGIDLKGLEFTATMIAGMFGNFQQESGVRFQVTQGHVNDSADNTEAMSLARNAVGLGMAQWTGGRAVKLVQAAQDADANWYDGQVQIQLLVDELASSHRSAYESLSTASSPSDAAIAFHRDFERSADSEDTVRKVRGGAAETWYERLSGFDGGSGCVAGDAQYGSVGDVPTDTHTYAWMCDTVLHICRDGDYGTPMIEWSGDYQCYWYWLARSYILFNGDIRNPHTATGGGLAAWAAAQPDWTRSDEPRPGAGVSFDGGGINHVAVVEKVEPDPSGWRIFISEGNAVDGLPAGHWNEYNTRWLTKTQYQAGGGAGFFWKNSWDI